MATPSWSDKYQKWILQVRIDGKRRSFVSRTPGRQGLVAVRKAYQLALLGESDKSEWRLNRCWTEFLIDCKALSGSAHYRQCESFGRIHILPKLGVYKVSRISDQDWQNVITSARPTDPDKHQLARKTLMDLRGVITSFCKYAKKAKMIEEIPTDLRIPKTAPSLEKGILLPDQLKRLFDPIDAWYANAWRFMVVTGLRPGEVYGLQRGDIKDGVLRIQRSINAMNEITPGKNKNAHRGIVLHPIALSIIQEQKKQLKDAGIASPWLFPDSDGSQPCPRNAFKQWSHYRKVNGITISLYGLRHTFVSLTQHTVPLAMLKKLVGHSESMDTHGTYGHVVEGDMQAAADLVNRALRKWLE